MLEKRYQIRSDVEFSNGAYTWIETKEMEITTLNGKHEALEDYKHIIKRLYPEYSIKLWNINIFPTIKRKIIDTGGDKV